ncbi:MAG: hypothetical protein SGJ20_20040 [Planctomycetota bacterium]|nr:hypothetical protein [Planctomycetota bacterium]
MKRGIIALLGLVLLAGNTGCCGCIDYLRCHQWGLCPWGGCKTEQNCGPGGCATGDCASGDCGGECADCGPQGHFAHKRQRDMINQQDPSSAAAAGAAAYQGPPTAAVAYPYYTNKSPGDFFNAHPASIGP